jgi:probable phosphoglycerate mutase
MPGVPLNEEGQQQAKNLAERLKGLPIAAIYSSPVQRAVETAAPLAKVLNLETRIAEDFLELDLGEWTNLPIEELRGDSQFNLFNTFRSNTRIPGGELMLEAQLRMVQGIQKLCKQHPEETIAIVSHGDPIKAAVAYFAGIHLDLFHRLEISPASVSVVEIYPETARVLHVNDVGRLLI